MRRLPHPGQLEMTFFPVPETPRTDAGGLDISMSIRDALVETLSAASVQGMDRYEVAALVSRLSGRDMSKNMLDRYCAPSADDYRTGRTVVAVHDAMHLVGRRASRDGRDNVHPWNDALSGLDHHVDLDAAGNQDRRGRRCVRTDVSQQR
jgi:hypothetical protein